MQNLSDALTLVILSLSKDQTRVAVQKNGTLSLNMKEKCHPPQEKRTRLILRQAQDDGRGGDVTPSPRAGAIPTARDTSGSPRSAAPPPSRDCAKCPAGSISARSRSGRWPARPPPRRGARAVFSIRTSAARSRGGRSGRGRRGMGGAWRPRSIASISRSPRPGEVRRGQQGAPIGGTFGFAAHHSASSRSSSPCSTLKTGRSAASASRSRQCQSSFTIACALGGEEGGAGDAPVVFRVGLAHFPAGGDHARARLLVPGPAALVVELLPEGFRQGLEVLGVLHRVFDHLGGERAARPVGLLAFLVERPPAKLLHQRAVAERLQPDELRGQHGVENGLRLGRAGPAEHAQVEIGPRAGSRCGGWSAARARRAGRRRAGR